MTLVPTGIARLDELLGGGLPEAASVLVNGPRFTAKGAVARRALATATDDGRTTILIATSRDAQSERAAVAPEVTIIDAVSRLFGADENVPGTLYVDGPRDLNGIATALNTALRDSDPDHPAVVIIDSVSTLIAYGGSDSTFRFLQVLVGRARRAGATMLLLMDDDMHDAKEVAWVRHLADAAIETRADAGRLQMRLLGIGNRQDLGWIEYSAGESIDLTGSFAAGRIR